MLVEHYYSILDKQTQEQSTVFTVALHADSPVYAGHFPNEPISPGVCNIQLIKECAETVTGHLLRLRSMQQCRFMHLITPLLYPQVEVRITLLNTSDNGVKLRGTIGSANEIFIELRSEFDYE